MDGLGSAGLPRQCRDVETKEGKLLLQVRRLARDFGQLVDRVLVRMPAARLGSLPADIKARLAVEDCAHVCPELKKHDPTLTCPPTTK